MKTTPITAIKISPDRQRQEFDPDAMQELISSILDRGLFHPVVLREEEGALVLVAGERRLRAMQEIWTLGSTFSCDNVSVPEGSVPFVTLGELSYLEAEEAELDENLKRRDLTWQEHAQAVARLHQLRDAQRREELDFVLEGGDQGEVEAAEARYNPQTIADTAEELTGRRDGSFHDTVRKELIVARHLDNPAVAKAKTADEAFKILKREEEQQRNRELAKTVGASFNASEHEAYNTNCLEWMAKPENAGRFDVILTDPPYGMGAQSFGDGAGRLAGIEHHYDDSYEAWRLLMGKWVRLAYKVTKPQAHAYVFCDIERFGELKLLMESEGWYVFRTPMINVKTNSGRVPLPDRGPRRQYEILLYAIKGEKPVTHIYPDVITSQADENMSHGAQKPVSLFQNLLQRSVRPGDSVLDAFAGTGTIFPAAHAFKCRAVGLEKSPEYYGLCIKRLELLKELDEGPLASLLSEETSE